MVSQCATKSRIQWLSKEKRPLLHHFQGNSYEYVTGRLKAGSKRENILYVKCIFYIVEFVIQIRLSEWSVYYRGEAFWYAQSCSPVEDLCLYVPPVVLDLIGFLHLQQLHTHTHTTHTRHRTQRSKNSIGIQLPSCSKVEPHLVHLIQLFNFLKKMQVWWSVCVWRTVWGDLEKMICIRWLSNIILQSL